MELGLVKRGEVQLTPSGSLYIEKLSDTLHRVKRYKISFIGGETKEITHEQYSNIQDVLFGATDRKYIKFKDGQIVAINQIASIKPYEVIVDTSKEVL